MGKVIKRKKGVGDRIGWGRGCGRWGGRFVCIFTASVTMALAGWDRCLHMYLTV